MKKLLTILFLLLGLVGVKADTSAYPDFIVRHYTEDNGLLNDIVNCSLKSRDGFLWFGTWYGLSRFDGTKFQNFSNAYTVGSDQPPRKVETLVEDGCGNIWIKTLDWKLSVLFKQTERFEDVYDELKPYSKNLQIIKIQSDGKGHVLLLTKNKNLLLAQTHRNGTISVRILARSKGMLCPFDDHLKDNLVDIRNGYASWVGKDYKLFAVKIPSKGDAKYRQKSYWRRYFEAKAKASDTYHDRYGNLWTIENDAALVYENPKTHLIKRFPFTLFGRITVPRFCDAGEHGVFFLTSAGEAIHINQKTLEAEKISRMHQVADNKVDSRYFSMNYAKDGILWLTTTNNGVFSFLFPPHHFRIIPLPKTDKEGVRSLYQFPNGDVWVGTRSKNLYILDANGRVKGNLSYAQYKIGSVYYIMKDSRHRLWLSTKGDGLVEAIPDRSQPSGYRFVHFRHNSADKNSISGDNVYITYEDSRHHLWVGTLDGGLNLMVEHQGKITFQNKYHGMKGYPSYGLYMEVRNMTEDNHGRIWVGTIDGLMSFRADFKNAAQIKFDTYRSSPVNTLANGDIYVLYKDRKQNIWVGTFGGGLSRIVGYDDKNKLPRFESVGPKEGLQNDVIISILEDHKGQLWLGNTNGVSCFNRATDRIRNFDHTDGFPAVTMEETASLNNNRNGEIWMGCKDGILAFQPERLKTSMVQYPVYIVGCSVNNQDIRSNVEHPILQKSITYTDEMELKHDQNMFTLEFAALNYKYQNHVTYRHLLDGFDKNWHYDGQNRLASYTNVPPGEYTFIVEAMDAAHSAHYSRCSMKVTILPPWWATWWAYTIYGLFFIMALYGVLRYTKYQIRLKNDVYIQSKLAEYKRKYEMEQEDAHFLEIVNKVIEENLVKSDFEIDVIANQLGMSRSAFFKRLKALTNTSPSEYVKDYKLARAVEYLKNSDLSITDVAYRSGFSEVGYFGKCFRKKYGMSPRDFKKQ